MGTRPVLPAVSRSGWLALGLSVAAHAAVLALLCCLPGEQRGEDGFIPIDACVLDDDGPAGPSTPPAPAAGPHEVATPVAVAVAPPPVDPDQGTRGPPEPGPAPPSAEAPGTGDGAVGGGTGAPGTFFQVPVQGARVVYVIDRSASMGLGDGLAAAKRELLASLARLGPGTRFQVIFYNRDADVLRVAGQSDLVPATPENVRETAHLLGHLRAEGSTNHLQALRRALALEPDVLFFVTDAADLTPEQVRLVTQCNGGRTVIHTIDLGGADEGDPLEALARNNGGTYRRVAD